MSEPDISSIHFIGIGGVGMSGIALVAVQRGYAVSGSDLKKSKTSRRLEQGGIDIFIGHDAQIIDDMAPDVVVISSAIPETNPELARARELGIEVWQRAKMLAYLGTGRKTLAVAGTHGKTTTSSMLATTLDRMGEQPTFLIGGTVDGYDTNAVDGRGEYFVVEADESDGSFLHLDPFVAIITNVEADHLDHYGSLEEIEETFVEFMSRVPATGAVVVCGDDPHLPEIAHRSGARVISYGFDGGCDTVCRLDGHTRTGSSGLVQLPGGAEVEVHLPRNPGRHNILNASAVLTALDFLGYDMEQAAHALSTFSGVRRRFDHIATVDGIEIVDDYAHHPTEIAATIHAASELGYDRVHVLFQPHRYTRTQSLADQFADAFVDADTVTVMNVYSAGETPIPGVSGKTIATSILSKHPEARVTSLEHTSEVVPFITGLVEPGDLLLTMGAGDVTEMGPLIAAELEKRG